METARNYGEEEELESLLPPFVVWGADLGPSEGQGGEHFRSSYLVLVIGTHAVPGLRVVLSVPTVTGIGRLGSLLGSGH